MSTFDELEKPRRLSRKTRTALTLLVFVIAALTTQAEGQETPGRSMRVRVTERDGKPIARAKVHVSVWTKEPFPANQDYVCDAQGEVAIKLPRTMDTLRLWGSAAGHVPLFAHWESEELQGDASRIPEEFSFELPQGTVVGGFVKNEDQQPIVGARVEVKVRIALEEQEKRVCISHWLATGDNALVTDAEGRWTLDNVPAGDDVEVLVRLNHPDYIADYQWGLLQKLAKVTTAALRQQSGTIVMARGICVTGSVTDSSGKPVVGAVVVWSDDPYMMEGSQEVFTDERGMYRLHPLPDIATTLTVVAPGWAPELKKIQITRQNPPEDVRLQSGETLRLKFVDDMGNPVPDVHVGIVGWRGSKSLYNHRHPNVCDTKIPIQADANGVYEWTWAPSDPVEYSFYKEGYRTITGQRYEAGGAEHEVKLTR